MATLPKPVAHALREQDLEIRVRYQETDAMGVLHHANYLTYFEMGRTELMRLGGFSYRALEDSGVLMVVVKLAVRYKLPARYDDVLRLQTRVDRVTVSRIEHSYRLYRHDELLTEAESTMACVDREGRLQRVPEWMRDPA